MIRSSNTFSASTWRRNAKSRRGTNKEALHRDYVAITGLGELVSYATENDIEIYFRQGMADCYIAAVRVAYINSNRVPESQLFALSHELGHAAILEIPIEDYARKYGKQWETQSEKIRGLSNIAYKHRHNIILEEIDAWREGKFIIQTLDIDFDDERFRLEESKSLSTYYRWASQEKAVCPY